MPSSPVPPLAPDWATTRSPTHNGSLSVTPASLSITAKNQTKVYGQTLTLAGTAFTETGLVNNDSITSVTLTSTGAAAAATVAGSPYAIVPTAAVGTGLGNYAIAYAQRHADGQPRPHHDHGDGLDHQSAHSARPITITATVSANAPGSGTPTGTVDFFDATTGVDLGKSRCRAARPRSPQRPCPGQPLDHRDLLRRQQLPDQRHHREHDHDRPVDHRARPVGRRRARRSRATPASS